MRLETVAGYLACRHRGLAVAGQQRTEVVGFVALAGGVVVTDGENGAETQQGAAVAGRSLGDWQRHRPRRAAHGGNLPESQFPAPTLADHQARDLEHRQRTQHLRRWQTGRDRDLVGGARAARRKRVVDT